MQQRKRKPAQRKPQYRMKRMPIRPNVVGSYPVPHWLMGDSSRVALRDAIMVVLKTQERAGIDVIADGELNRFNPSHPETNGMIDYFVSRMDGINTRFSLRDIEKFREGEGLAYRREPPGLAPGAIPERALHLPRALQFPPPPPTPPPKFTCTS